MLNLIKTCLSTTRHKQKRIFYHNIDKNVTTFFKQQNPNLWNEFNLSRNEFIKQYGSTPEVRNFLEENIFIKVKRGYIGFDGNTTPGYNTYRWHPDILKELVENSSKQINKRAAATKLLTTDNSEITEKETGFKNRIGKNIKLLYTSDGNGRLHNKIQHIPKELRSTLLKGWYLYDINAAAPTILHQLFTRITRKELNHIPYYCKNKTKLREEWAEAVGCDIKTIKSIINSLFFGGVIPTESQLKANLDFKFAIQKTLTDQQIKKLWAIQEFSWLREETRFVMMTISNHYRTEDKSLTNAAGITKHFERWSYRHVCYHLYVGVEVSILQIILSRLMHDNRGGLFLLHDGFAAQASFEIEGLEMLIKETTGYKVTYDKTTI